MFLPTICVPMGISREIMGIWKGMWTDRVGMVGHGDKLLYHCSRLVLCVHWGLTVIDDLRVDYVAHRCRWQRTSLVTGCVRTGRFVRTRPSCYTSASCRDTVFTCTLLLIYHFKCSGIYKSGQCHPGLNYVFNFWHSGTLALSRECQSARMSN